MKNVFMAVISLISCLMLLIYLINNYVSESRDRFEDNSEVYEQYVGDTVVLNTDTLIVVQYSVLRECFTLSNGLDVNKNLIMKHE